MRMKKASEKKMEKAFKDIAETMKEECKDDRSWKRHSGAGAVYGLGFLGAAWYYITTAPDIWAILIGIVKAALWPGFLVHAALTFLGA